MKFSELSSELSEFFDCEQKVIDLLEIQGKPEEIIKHKLEEAYSTLGQVVLVDDVSTHFEVLNGFPGPYVKDFFDCFTPYEIGNKFTDSRVKMVCWLGLCRGEGDTVIVNGTLEGIVVPPKQKDHGGRWLDLVVQAEGTDKPMIEFSYEEKNKFSHRGKAMRNLLAILKTLQHN